jgi:L-amino acid N-acyltransferase YncA
MNLQILAMQPEHWPAVRDIYREDIATGNATFGTSVPDWEKWNSSHRKDCRLVAFNNDRVVGWAALSPVSQRQVYEGVAEVSVYVAVAPRGQGFGSKLLDALVQQSEAAGIGMLQAGIFPSPFTRPADSAK